MTTRPDEPSPAWCRRLIAEFNDADGRAIALAGSLTPEQLNRTARPDEWSIGQCLEHLYNSNQEYLTPIADSLSGRSSGGVEEIRPGWFGRWFIRTYIEPSPGTRRARAPGKIAPAAHVDPSVLARFLASNAEARALVLRAKDCDVNRIRFRNPFIPLVRFTVGTGLEILSAHQRRHLLQAERISQSVHVD